MKSVRVARLSYVTAHHHRSLQAVSVGTFNEQVGESRVVIEAEHPFKGSDKYYARLIRR
jgi:hypothetical protein